MSPGRLVRWRLLSLLSLSSLFIVVHLQRFDATIIEDRPKFIQPNNNQRQYTEQYEHQPSESDGIYQYYRQQQPQSTPTIYQQQEQMGFVSPQSACKLKCLNRGVCAYWHSNRDRHSCLCVEGKWQGMFCEISVNNNISTVTPQTSSNDEYYKAVVVRPPASGLLLTDAYTIAATSSMPTTNNQMQLNAPIPPLSVSTVPNSIFGDDDEDEEEININDDEYNDNNQDQSTNKIESLIVHQQQDGNDDSMMINRNQKLIKIIANNHQFSSSISTIAYNHVNILLKLLLLYCLCVLMLEY